MLSVDYRGLEKFELVGNFTIDIKELGGDGFYSIVAIPYNEPALAGKKFGSTICSPGLCPVSEGLQDRVMCFKTNYRDLEEAMKNRNFGSIA